MFEFNKEKLFSLVFSQPHEAIFASRAAAYQISPVRTRYCGGEGHCVPPDVFL